MTDRRKKQKTTEQQATDCKGTERDAAVQKIQGYSGLQNGAAGSPLPKTRIKDTGAKLIFDNHTLCAQCLRGYTNVELLKDVQPEDIVSSRKIKFPSLAQKQRIIIAFS